MIEETLDSLDHLVLPYEPDAGQAISATFRVDADVDESLTKREGRTPNGATLRVVDYQATYVLGQKPAGELRNAIRTMAEDDGVLQVRIPFWPAVPNSGFSSRWFMSFDKSATGDVGDVTNITWSNVSGDVPTLLGYLNESPKMLLQTTARLECAVRWKESSPSTEALVPTTQSWTSGPAIGARTIYVFPFVPTEGPGDDAGEVEVDVRSQAFGFTRRIGTEAYPQIGRRKPVFRFTLNDGDPSKLLRFFLDRQGPVEAFWLPGWFAEAQLAQDTSAGSADVVVNDATPLTDFSYLAFYSPGGSVVTRKIISRVGNTLTLSSSPGELSKINTVVCSLVLARFSGAEMTLRWQGPLALAQVSFTEVTQEYTTPSGETYNETIGNLPARANGVVITHGAEVWRWTNYESDLTYLTNTYSALTGGLEIGEIVDGFAWEKNSTTLRIRNFTGNPFARFASTTATERMQVTIYEFVVASPVITATVLFKGWVRNPEFDGPWITVNPENLGALFDVKIPRVLLQPNDNYALFDRGNRLAVSDWTFLGDVTSVSGRTLTIEHVSGSLLGAGGEEIEGAGGEPLGPAGGGALSFSTNYFALGYAVRPAPHFDRILIVSSTATSGSSFTVTLVREIDGLGAEIGWEFIPGYDGHFDTARDKFSNESNFGGFPDVPMDNPTLSPKKKAVDSGGKK